MTTMQIKGKIERKGFGMGVWALVSEEGQTYELWNPPSDLCHPLETVLIQGTVQEEIMTIAMIGPVLKVNHFTILSS